MVQLQCNQHDGYMHHRVMFLIRNLNYSAYVYVTNRERDSIKIPFDAPQVDKLPQEGLMSQALVEVEWSPGKSEPLPTLMCRSSVWKTIPK